MKKQLLIITCIFACISFFLFSCNKEDDEINFRVEKAMKIDNVKSMTTSPSTTYRMTCPDGSIGCGGTFGAACYTSIDCGPITPMREALCLNRPEKACELSTASTPICTQIKSCPPPTTNPNTMHPVPCNWGNIPFACVSGYISGPSCSKFEVCQTPPN